MAKETELIPTLDQVAAILSEPKIAVKPMEWIGKKSGRAPLWLEYVSACAIGSEIREDVLVRMQFRASSTQYLGAATIEIAAQFNAAICVGGHRIYAIDTTDKPHTNAAGRGRGLHGKVIRDRTHEHTWSTEGYGYAEPISPPYLSVESLIAEFLRRANVTITGGFVHPLKGTQGELEL